MSARVKPETLSPRFDGSLPTGLVAAATTLPFANCWLVTTVSPFAMGGPNWLDETAAMPSEPLLRTASTLSALSAWLIVACAMLLLPDNEAQEPASVPLATVRASEVALTCACPNCEEASDDPTGAPAVPSEVAVTARRSTTSLPSESARWLLPSTARDEPVALPGTDTPVSPNTVLEMSGVSAPLAMASPSFWLLASAKLPVAP